MFNQISFSAAQSRKRQKFNMPFGEQKHKKISNHAHQMMNTTTETAGPPPWHLHHIMLQNMLDFGQFLVGRMLSICCDCLWSVCYLVAIRCLVDKNYRPSISNNHWLALHQKWWSIKKWIFSILNSLTHKFLALNFRLPKYWWFDRFPFDIFNFPLVLLIVPNGFDKREWVALIASEKPSFTSEPASFTWERASFTALNWNLKQCFPYIRVMAQL